MRTAFILAGGVGFRLSSTEHLPKPMRELPFRNGKRPIIGHIINNLITAGFNDILISVGFGKEPIRHYLNQEFKSRCNLRYVESHDKIYRSIIHAADELPEDFLMLNADNFTDIDLNQLWDDHKKNRKRKKVYTIATVMLEKGAQKCGLLEGVEGYPYDQIGFIPKGHDSAKGYIDSGLVAASQDFICDLEVTIDKMEKPSYHVFRKILAEEGKIGISYQENRFWYDIGTFKELFEAKRYLRKEKRGVDELNFPPLFKT